MTHIPSDIDEFFRALRSLSPALGEGTGSPPSIPREFFRHAMQLRSMLHRERKSCANRFNIFRTLGIETNEILHSKLIACLLDPNGYHDQGTFPLESFLTMAGLRHLLPSDVAAEQIFVWTEWPIANGRIDIAIFIGDSTVVCIENKIGAPEQPDQIGRYQQWLSRACKDTSRTAIVFLTPDARTATTAMTGSGANAAPISPISYGDMATWLDDLGRDVPRQLGMLLGMYRDVCDQIVTTANGIQSSRPTQERGE